MSRLGASADHLRRIRRRVEHADRPGRRAEINRWDYPEFRLSNTRQDDFARESFRAPVEAHLALQLASNHALHHARAEAPTRGRLDGRAARLGPAQDEPSVWRMRPLDPNVACRAPTRPRTWPRWSLAHARSPQLPGPCSAPATHSDRQSARASPRLGSRRASSSLTRL